MTEEDLVRLIASWPAHPGDHGPDNEVICDRLTPDPGQDIGEAPATIHRLARQIIALFPKGGSGEAVIDPTTREHLEREIKTCRKYQETSTLVPIKVLEALLAAHPAPKDRGSEPEDLDEARALHRETMAYRVQYRIDAAVEEGRETVAIGLPMARQLVAALSVPKDRGEGWREALEEIRDLLMERIHGNPARSPAHNARLKVEALLAASPSPRDKACPVCWGSGIAAVRQGDGSVKESPCRCEPRDKAPVEEGGLREAALKIIEAACEYADASLSLIVTEQFAGGGYVDDGTHSPEEHQEALDAVAPARERVRKAEEALYVACCDDSGEPRKSDVFLSALSTKDMEKQGLSLSRDLRSDADAAREQSSSLVPEQVKP